MTENMGKVIGPGDHGKPGEILERPSKVEAEKGTCDARAAAYLTTHDPNQTCS